MRLMIEMPILNHSFRRLTRLAALPIFAAASLAAQPNPRPERPGLNVSAYVIDAEIDTTTHRLAAKATVTLTAPENAEMVSFGFHPALKVNKITDEKGKVLTGERSADGTIRDTPATPPVADQPMHWIFDYEGVITGTEDGPVEGLKLAAIQEPISYLLYPARWFPTAGFMTDRFTAEIHIRVPQGMKVFGSGAQGQPHPAKLADGKPGDQFDFNWTKPGFPGTIIAGRFVGPASAGMGSPNVYLTVNHQAAAGQLSQTASREFAFFTNKFGALESGHINVVELPDDTLPSAYAPGRGAGGGARAGGGAGGRRRAD